MCTPRHGATAKVTTPRRYRLGAGRDLRPCRDLWLPAGAREALDL